MNYKEKMKTEHPTVDSNFVLFACPGHYFENGPSASGMSCPKNDGSGGGSCIDCWNTEIPGPNTALPELEPSEKTMAKKIASRVKALYCAFRDEDLNDREAFELTKLIIAEELRSRESTITLF